MRRLERASPGCEAQERACARVVLEYPVVASAPGGPEAASAIARAIAEPVLRSLDEQAEVVAPELLAERFVADFAVFDREHPGRTGWSLERHASVVMSTAEVLSVEVAEYSYTGGAHPNALVTLLCLSPGTGRPLALSELLVMGFEEPLRVLAEERFRRARQLAPDASLAEEGFWFDEDRFQLNANWLVAPEGLRFFFDAYEIAPYVFGPTELVVEREALRALARAGGPLAAGKSGGGA